MTNLADNLESILARAAAQVDERPGSAPPSSPPDDFAARRVRALAARGWPARALRIAGGESYDERQASSYLEALRDRDGDGQARIVVLAGQPGSGKTAACARWALTRPGPARSAQFETPRFATSAAFFRSPRYRRDEEPILTRDALLRERALVLDDLGVEFADGSGSYRVDFDELVNEFYSDDRLLVISTNLVYPSAKARDAAKAKGAAVDEQAPTFADRYGERILDRVRECGRWVDSQAASMRTPGGRR